MVAQLSAVIEELQPRRIVELGIANGGSAALLAAPAPRREGSGARYPAPGESSADHIERHSLNNRIRPYYEVDQADVETLRRILSDEFGEAPIDVVIDDASHELAATRASLDVLFPLLRPGGCFVLEDWAWAHLGPMDLNWAKMDARWSTDVSAGLRADDGHGEASDGTVDQMTAGWRVGPILERPGDRARRATRTGRPLGGSRPAGGPGGKHGPSTQPAGPPTAARGRALESWRCVSVRCAAGGLGGGFAARGGAKGGRARTGGGRPRSADSVGPRPSPWYAVRAAYATSGRPGMHQLTRS